MKPRQCKLRKEAELKRARLDDIDEALSSILGKEDFYASSSALIELKKKNPEKALNVSIRILDEKLLDVFFQAFAFEILYSISLSDALIYIEANIRNVDAYILGAMLSSVAEDVGLVAGKDEIMKAVALLKDELSKRSKNELEKIGSFVEWFRKTYPSN